ncbi:MAG: hypothetical protein IJ601_02280 [Acidaminococcaceae bacterium]|nr:hypothetical protein [Acidaminococcaceae bacterium]
MLNKNTKVKTHRRWHQEYKAAFLVWLKTKENWPCLRAQLRKAILGIRYCEKRKGVITRVRAAGVIKALD